MVVTMSTKESSPPAIGKRRQRQRQRQRQEHPPQQQQQQQYGMDTAPPLVSLSLSSSSFQQQQQQQDSSLWQRRRIKADSLQRLGTLNGNASSVCPPLVMPPRYVVSVCHNGILRVFDLVGHPFDHKEEPFFLSLSSSFMDPHWSIETNLQGPTAMATDQTNNNNNNENHIAVIDVNGTVSLVAFSSSSSSLSDTPQVVQTFQTDTPNATCIGWNQHNRTITIGYQCGQLEEWQVPHSSPSPPSPPRRRRPSASSSSSSSLPVLLWRGTLGDPIASLQPTLGMNRHKYCAVCIQQRVKPILQRPLHSASVQVLDRSIVMQQYQQNQRQQHNGQRRQLMDLLPFTVWPEIGFQSVDPVHVQPALQNKSDAASLQQQTRSVPFGSNLMAACPNAVAAALFDGSVGVLHSLVQETNDNDDNNDDDGDRQSSPSPSLQWGIAHKANRVVLSHPSIGLGFLQYQERNHVVCCLRAGTIYLLPIVDKLPTSSSSDDDNHYPPVTVLYRPIPHDPETNLQQLHEDPLLFHLHSFACGNLVWDATATDHQEQSNNSASLPIVVYVGPAGLMEVYVCGLSSCCQQQQEPPPVVQEMVLEEMLANGTVQQLIDTLHSPNHDELNHEIWTRARAECRARPPQNPTHVLDDHHQKYPHMVALLLHLAKL